jgi:hypothetical protein
MGIRVSKNNIALFRNHFNDSAEQPLLNKRQLFLRGGKNMVMDKQLVISQAPEVLNRADQPWEVTVEGDSIIARWKWMDATFFSPAEVNNQVKEYTFTVTLGNKGKWKEIDKTEQKSSGVSMSGGKLSLGSSSNTFKGNTNRKSISFGTGKNNETGEVGLITFKFDTSVVKNPIRSYLESCGWKKAGLFG